MTKNNEIKSIRTYLKETITKNQFVGHDIKRKQVFDLLYRTIQHGESNSALLIGPRGSGKSTLVNQVIEELQNEVTAFESNAILVRLHGLVHTDDRLALISATNQMNLDNAVDGKVFGSFAENLTFLLACLRTGEKHTTKSVLFILEEFDLFCAHHNQTLLYNLLDVSQSAQAPICILGITCRFDVIELLEKRVKSRFSHRQIFIFSGQEEDDKNSDLNFTLDKIKSYLSLPNSDILNITGATRKKWSTNLKTLLADKKLKNSIQRLIDLDLNEKALKNVLIKIVSDLNEESNKLTAEAFNTQISLFEKDDMVQVLQDLNVLELCLVISMKHHCDIYDNQPMNFEMVLTRYIKFAKANSNMQSVQRPVIMKAFEHIENLELISMMNLGGKSVQREYQLFKLLVTPSQISEAISKSVGLPTEVIQWANSSLA